jgi:hypothetical protein
MDPTRRGKADPVTGRIHTGPEEGTRLRHSDLLVIDEAGMLDKDTVCALLTAGIRFIPDSEGDHRLDATAPRLCTTSNRWKPRDYRPSSPGGPNE